VLKTKYSITVGNFLSKRREEEIGYKMTQLKPEGLPQNANSTPTAYKINTANYRPEYASPHT